MRLGDVLVGKLADRVAGQHRLHAISGTLPGNRATEARLLAADQDGGLLVPVGAERYADFGGAGFGHLDAGGLGLAARIAGPQRVAAGRNVRDAKAALDAGRATGNDPV